MKNQYFSTSADLSIPCLFEPSLLLDLSCWIHSKLVLEPFCFPLDSIDIPVVETGSPKSMMGQPEEIIHKQSGIKILLEPSINALRVSISFTHQLSNTSMLYDLLRLIYSRQELNPRPSLFRRQPLPGYDLSFLFTNEHLKKYTRTELVEKFVEIMKHLDCMFGRLLHQLNHYEELAAETFVISVLECHATTDSLNGAQKKRKTRSITDGRRKFDRSELK